MTKIRIDTERTRAVGRQLIFESNHLTEIEHELQRAIDRLDTRTWDGHSRMRAEPMLDQVRPAVKRPLDELEQLGQTLVRAAKVFEERDQNVVNFLSHIIDLWPPRKPPSWGPEIPLWPPFSPPGDWRPLPWPPRYWPILPLLPLMPIRPPWFRPPWRWPRPGIQFPKRPSTLPKLMQEPKLEPRPEPEPETEPQPEPQSPSSAGSTTQAGTETCNVDTNAPIHDCVAFVNGQRSAPAGFTSDNFYSGQYKGQSGALADGTEYGQEPKVGSIMVESPNSQAQISYGHASYVYEVTRDDSGKVTSYKIAEGGWDKKTDIHYDEFHWDETKQGYVSSSGRRNPDMFVY